MLKKQKHRLGMGQDDRLIQQCLNIKRAQTECDESKGLGSTTSFHCVVFAGSVQNKQPDLKTNE